MLDTISAGNRKLNVGCGFDKRPGYVNIDLQSFHQPDLIGNAIDLPMVPSNWADELLVSDVIEHIKRTQTLEAMLEWNRVLAVGGTMHLRTTYLTGLLRRMDHDWFGSLETHRQLILNLFSSQKYEGDFHFTAFTEKLLRFYVWASGFEVVTLNVRDGWLFDLVAKKSRDLSYEDLVQAKVDDKAFVCDAYRQILERNADEDGLAGKLSLLRNGGVSRRQIVKGFLASEEYEGVKLRAAPDFQLQFDPA